MADNNKLAELYVEIRAKADSLERDLEKIKSKAQATSNSMASSFKSVGAALGIAFGVEQVISFMKSSVEAFAKSEAAANKLTVALGRTSDALIEYASELQRTTAFADDDIVAAQARIAMFVKDENQIKKLTKATLDFAAAKDMDLVSAADLVAKTVGSETNALGRYGIEVEGAKGSTERLSNTIEGLNTLFSGQATAQLDTYAGKLANLRNKVDDVSESIGEVLVDAIYGLNDAFNALNANPMTWLTNMNINSTVQGIINATTNPSEYVREAIDRASKDITTKSKSEITRMIGEIEKSLTALGKIKTPSIDDKNTIDQLKAKLNVYKEFINPTTTGAGDEILTNLNNQKKKISEINNTLRIRKDLTKEQRDALIKERDGLTETANAYKTSNKTKTEMLEDFYSNATFLSEDYYDRELQRIKLERDAYINAGVKKSDADRLYEQQLQNLIRRRDEFNRAQLDAEEYVRSVKQKVEAENELERELHQHIEARAGLYKQDADNFLKETSRKFNSRKFDSLNNKGATLGTWSFAEPISVKPVVSRKSIEDDIELIEKSLTQMRDVVSGKIKEINGEKLEIDVDDYSKSITHLENKLLKKKEELKEFTKEAISIKPEIDKSGKERIKRELEDLVQTLTEEQAVKLNMDLSDAFDASKKLSEIERTVLSEKTLEVDVVVKEGADAGNLGRKLKASNNTEFVKEKASNASGDQKMTPIEQYQQYTDQIESLNSLIYASEVGLVDGLMSTWDTFYQGIRIAQDDSKKFLIVAFVEIANAFINQVKRMVAEWLAFTALRGILGILTGGASEAVVAVAAPGAHSGGVFQGGNKTPLGLAGGGSFTVPPGFPNDSFPMLVESGERVSVTPRSAVSSGGLDNKLLAEVLNAIKAQTMTIATKESTVNINAGVNGIDFVRSVTKPGENAVIQNGVNTRELKYGV